MHKYRYVIYANILMLAAIVTAILQKYSHRSNHPLPTEAEQIEMRYADSLKFKDITREVDYVIPD
jgi:hypothetical protein